MEREILHLRHKAAVELLPETALIRTRAPWNSMETSEIKAKKHKVVGSVLDDAGQRRHALWSSAHHRINPPLLYCLVVLENIEINDANPHLSLAR